MAARKRGMSARDRAELARAWLESFDEFRDEVGISDAELEDMTGEELLDYMASIGVDVNDELLDAEVRGALGPGVVLMDQGRTLDEHAQEEMATRASRAVQRASQSVARQVTKDTRQNALDDGDERPPDRQYMMWVSVGEGVCPSCHTLHGQIMPRDAWDDIGLPGDGSTYCGIRCRCKLVAVEATEADTAVRDAGDIAERAGLLSRRDLPSRRE